MATVDLSSLLAQPEDGSSEPIPVSTILGEARRLVQSGETLVAFDYLLGVATQLEETGLAEASLAVVDELRHIVPLEAVPSSQVAWLHNVEGLALGYLERTREAIATLENMRSLGEQTNDRSILATAYQNLGNNHLRLRDFVSARQSYAQSLQLHLDIQDGWSVFQALANLASLELEANDLKRANEWLGILKKIVGSHKAVRMRMDLAFLDARYAVARHAYDEAIDLYRIALRLARYLNDPDAKLLALRNLGNAYLDANMVGGALRCIRRALQLAQDLRATGHLLALERLLGVALHRANRHREAVAHFTVARDLAIELKDRRVWAEVIADLGALSILRSKTEKGLRLLAESLPVFAELDDHDWMIRVLRNQLSGYSQLNDAESGRATVERLLGLYPEDAIDERSEALTIAANLLLKVGYQVDQAAALYARAVQETDRSDDLPRRAWINAESAASLMQYHVPLAARPFWDKAVELYGESKSEHMLLHVLNDRAICYAYLGQYEEARADVAACALSAERLADRVMQAQVQHNLSEIARREGLLPEAMEAAARALQLSEGLGDFEAIASAHNAVAHTLEDLTQDARAVEHYETALYYARTVKDGNSEAMALRGLGNAAFRAGSLRQAAMRYRAAARLWREVGDQRHRAEATVSLIDCLMGMGRDEAVDQAYRELLSVVDYLEDPTYAMEAFLASMRWLLRDDLQAAVEMCAKGLTISTMLPRDETRTAGDLLVASIIRFDQQVRRFLPPEQQMDFWRRTAAEMHSMSGAPEDRLMSVFVDARRIADELDEQTDRNEV